MSDVLAAYTCPTVITTAEGATFECLAPRDHPGRCFLSQVAGPEHDPGDFGGQST